MNHSYQPEDKEFFDYQIYQYKNWLLRGPKPDLTKPYICFIGAAQTFGRYCQRPFVHQVSQHLGIPAMNFGIAGADPSYFLKDDIISCANESVLTVFQVLSARSCTNSLFTNKSGCREGFAYGQPMVSNNFWAKGQDVKIVQESQDQYIKTMKKLFTLVRGKKVLFWISTRQPKHNTSYQTLSNIFPHFVNKNVKSSRSPICFFSEKSKPLKFSIAS